MLPSDTDGVLIIGDEYRKWAVKQQAQSERNLILSAYSDVILIIHTEKGCNPLKQMAGEYIPTGIVERDEAVYNRAKTLRYVLKAGYSLTLISTEPINLEKLPEFKDQIKQQIVSSWEGKNTGATYVSSDTFLPSKMFSIQTVQAEDISLAITAVWDGLVEQQENKDRVLYIADRCDEWGLKDLATRLRAACNLEPESILEHSESEESYAHEYRVG